MCVRACVCERRWIGLIKSCVSRASCGDLYLLKSAAVDKLFVRAVQDQKEQRCAVRCCAVLSSLIKHAYTHNSFKRIWRRVKDDKHSSTEKCCCDEGGSGRGWRFLFRSAELSWTIASPFSSFSKLLRLLEANNTDWALSSRLEKRKKKKKKFLQSALRCDNLKNKFFIFFYNSSFAEWETVHVCLFLFLSFFFHLFNSAMIWAKVTALPSGQSQPTVSAAAATCFISLRRITSSTTIDRFRHWKKRSLDNPVLKLKASNLLACYILYLEAYSITQRCTHLYSRILPCL